MTVGWGTLAYGLTAGAQLGLSVVFLLNGARVRRPDPLMASLGFYSFSMGISALTVVRLHQATGISDYAEWIRIFGLFGLVAIVALVTLVAVWTAAIPRAALWVFAATTAVIAVFQLSLPNGLLIGEIDRLRTVELLGEQFVVHDGSASAWRPVLDVYLIGVFGLIVVAIVRGYRSGRRSNSVLMAATLIITLATSYYDSLVDFGIVETPYIAPFGALAPAIAGAMYLAERSTRNELQLVEQTTRLEETVVERTAALIDANRQLEEQLTRQRATARNLASLAERFELSNSVVAPNSTMIEESISGLLAALGTMVSARQVQLLIDADRVEGLVPRAVSWQHPDSEHTDDRHDDRPSSVVADIRIVTRTVGQLRADFDDGHTADPDADRYLELAAEHLAGLIHRIDLVAQVADSAVEDERQRIAMELHDSVTQRMYSVSFLADAATHEAADTSPDLAELVERIRELVLSSLAELRVLLLELRPKSFEDVELRLLLEQLADNLMSAYDTEIHIVAPTSPPLTTEVTTALYRISQEAISNACRHGNPDRVDVTFDQGGGTVRLDISDDGDGFDPTGVTSGSGIGNLRARAASIDAAIDIMSSPGGGTTVSVRLDQREPTETAESTAGPPMTAEPVER